ncbi:MAG: hypothetical protein ACFBSC_11505 [Microcoleaceae cyanobacterium]
MTQRQSSITVTQRVDRIFANGQVSRSEYSALISLILADRQTTDMERYQINRIFDYVQAGRIKLND